MKKRIRLTERGQKVKESYERPLNAPLIHRDFEIWKNVSTGEGAIVEITTNVCLEKNELKRTYKLFTE